MYTAKGQVDTDTYIQRYAPLVKRIAHHMMVRLPASVDVGDIIQAGMIGLLDAVRRYQVSQGAEFETYAIQRIRGAMLDELRQNDWLPRGLRRDMRRIEAMISQLEQRNGRQPNEKELADALGMSLPDYQTTLQEARGYQIVYFEDFSDSDDENFLDRHCPDTHPNPLEFLEDERVRAALIEAIDVLPEREKLVMGLYYEQELNLREIGEVLGVSESRVCQLHSQAVARLRAKLKPWAPEHGPLTRAKNKHVTA
ncbi:MAG: RNA polymerase sigma factor FliA [Betaproteobacteria bacterium]|nr:RNA polymerase sigma factor FliA [Betaproteobacteria bacterium]